MHREKISYLTKIYVSRKDIHALQEVMHYKKRKSCIPREIFIHRHQFYSFILIKVNIKNNIEDDIKRNTSTPHQLSFVICHIFLFHLLRSGCMLIFCHFVLHVIPIRFLLDSPCISSWFKTQLSC